MSVTRPAASHDDLLVRGDHPLIGIIRDEDGEDVVRYFADEQAVDAAADSHSIQQALALAGAWSDLDWSEMETALDRIRHESTPTPPVTER